MIEMLFGSKGGRLPRRLLLSGLLAMAIICQPAVTMSAETDAAAGDDENRILAIVYDQQTVHIATEKPVEYRYRVYTVQDPLRIVVDYPGMVVEDLDSLEFTPDDGLLDIKATTEKLPSGSLARVELLLARPVDYKVALDGTDFRVKLANEDEVSGDTAPMDTMDEETGDDSDSGRQVSSPASITPAKKILAVNASDNRVSLAADGKIEKFRYFPLGAPPRLVVDLYGVVPDFSKRAFPLDKGFEKVRIGTYPGKTRFVFDAAADQLPKYSVTSNGDAVEVAWNAEAVGKSNVSKAGSDVPVTVKAVDFKVENGRSILSIDLSGSAEAIEPVATGDIVRFGVRNANISRALRRAVDPSAFPSAIRLITPYTVLAGGKQDVRFAVELKGPVPYKLEKDGRHLRFIVENGPFAEPAPSSIETRKIPVIQPLGEASGSIPGVETARGMDRRQPQMPTVVEELSVGEIGEAYTGQKISLVFDDANVRNILQLIAEISDLNIIAGDDIKGTITLRLVDVPWDQALRLIMDIKGLGMLREGNVVRIMPKEKIRQMREEQFSSARALEKLEDLVTEVATVNYSDITSVADRSRERLTERGMIISDVRDKKLIITDIPSVVADIKRLIALLDTPERQVLIEARIVEASSTFSRDLGVNWGVSYDNNPGGGSDVSGDIGLGGGFALNPAAIAAGSAGFGSNFTFGQLGIDKLVLDLRISALEQSGHGRIISTPRVTTLNGEEAEIAQGTEIPYQSVSEQGTKTEFKKAELSLKVKPEINPDGSIFLEIEAKNDSRGLIVPTGLGGSAPAIDTKKAETKVLVRDGETTVIGGIFIEDKQVSEAGVPWLKSVPILGHLFKSRSVSEERRELLIFITPRILE